MYQDPHEKDLKIKLHYGDLTDSANIIRLIQEIQPDEIYNLGAMSHVRVSFDTPEYTANVDALGALRILEAVRLLNMAERTKIYQASTSELFGQVQEVPQTEKTPFYPRSPYGVAKLYGYWITVNYREAYNMFAVNGILFNHESPIRGETFVSRKITRAVARICLGLQDVLYMGNLDASRDWGHARDYVEAMWLMLQQETPEDLVIATGQTNKVRNFVLRAFEELGVKIEYQGNGIEEKATVIACDNSEINLPAGKVILMIDQKYYRPTEVDILLGDPTRAMEKLGWKPKYDFSALIKDMVHADFELFKRDQYLMKGGHKVFNYHE